MNKNKIIIGILIFVIIAMLGFMTFLFLTKEEGEKEISKKKEELTEEDIDVDASMAEYEIFDKPRMGDEVAIMKVKDLGEIKMKFFREVAPKAVENFIGLSKKGYYDGVTFHRVIDDFMIQGGDPTGTGAGGESFFGTDFGPEYKEGFFPYRGTLAMASKPGIENSLSSQFFIVQSGPESVRDEYTVGLPESIKRLYIEKGGVPSLYNEYTVFGFVYEGMDIVDKIAKTQTNENDKPLKDIIIESVKIIELEEDFE